MPNSEETPQKLLWAAQQWPKLEIDRSRRGNLVKQIVEVIACLVTERCLRAGSKMPSVRAFARHNSISTFTAANAYDRLVSLDVLESLPGSGYFVSGNLLDGDEDKPERVAPSACDFLDTLSTALYSGVPDMLPAGVSWLPTEWYGEMTVMNAMRDVIRMPANRLSGYGNTLGFPLLRQYLATKLTRKLFPVESEQILLTHGSTQVFDLILRVMTKPGDTVLVEDPGYGNLRGLILSHGCTPIGIARTAAGLDLTDLSSKAAQYRPKLMFVCTVVHNPLGTSLSITQAHDLLRLAEQFDFTIVEDEINRDLVMQADSNEPSLAALDGLRRVIPVGSFSRAISPALRGGFVAASTPLIAELKRLKLLTGFTTSEISERAIYHAISDPAYKRTMAKLSHQMDTARALAMDNLIDAGMTPLAHPRHGMFISAGWNVSPSPQFCGRTVAESAMKAGILLAPHEFFSLSPSKTVWFRFNVAHAASTQLTTFLKDAIHKALVQPA